MSEDSPRIVDVVFERRHPSHPGTFGLGLIGAVVAHVALFGWAMTRGPSMEDWSADISIRIHDALTRQDAIEVEKPKPPPPPPPPQTPPPKEEAPRPREASAKPPPPAQAGQILAAAPRAEGPVDLTDETFVTGTSEKYAGGTTTSTGTNAVAVHTGVVDRNAQPTPHPGEPDQSRPVGLDEEQWQCAWPAEADATDVDRQSVILRALVNADGTVASATIVSDPGLGFGAAAVACALKTRFEPAFDRAGHAIRSMSPPIRVRFTR